MSVQARKSASVWAAVPSLDEDLASTTIMSIKDLRGFWKLRWGDPPRYRSRDHLARAIAYRLQAKVHGDLSGKLKRQLTELGAKFADDRSHNPGPSIILKPGSSLIREWGGKRHEVAVTESGFIYEGERFASMSKVATRITGTKWNGPVFFGVKPRAVAA